MAPAEFTESTSLLDRPDDLIDRFREDGYLFFRGLIDPAPVLDVRRDVARTLAGFGWFAEGTDPMDAVPGPVIHREGQTEDWLVAYAAVQRLESFHRLAHADELLRPIRALAGGDEVLVHPRKIARVTYPGSGFPTPPHQDFPLIQGGTDVFTLWMPFGDCAREMGGLRILAGSHREGLREVIAAHGVAGVGVRADESDPRWRTTDYRCGDVLVFLSLTVHWAPENEGERVRLSSDYRYQSVAQPVVDGSLHPHGHPLIPDWDELTAGWSSTRWIAAPDGLSKSDIVGLGPELVAPESRFIPA